MLACHALMIYISSVYPGITPGAVILYRNRELWKYERSRRLASIRPCLPGEWAWKWALPNGAGKRRRYELTKGKRRRNGPVTGEELQSSGTELQPNVSLCCGSGMARREWPPSCMESAMHRVKRFTRNAVALSA
jgi:hypothetical protein